MKVDEAIKCVRATVWEGDKRVCMTRAILAGRVLADEVERRRKVWATAYRICVNEQQGSCRGFKAAEAEGALDTKGATSGRGNSVPNSD
jgi:hypothetical protein